MGHMDVVSIVSDAFNIYFPILLLILTLATYFSLGSRLLSFLGFQQFLEEAGHTGCESRVLVFRTSVQHLVDQIGRVGGVWGVLGGIVL